MKDLLRNCYYDGMTLEQTITFISEAYQETPTQRQINNFVKSLGASARSDWKQPVKIEEQK